MQEDESLKVLYTGQRTNVFDRLEAKLPTDTVVITRSPTRANFALRSVGVNARAYIVNTVMLEDAQKPSDISTSKIPADDLHARLRPKDLLAIHRREHLTPDTTSYLIILEELRSHGYYGQRPVLVLTPEGYRNEQLDVFLQDPNVRAIEAPYSQQEIDDLVAKIT